MTRAPDRPGAETSAAAGGAPAFRSGALVVAAGLVAFVVGLGARELWNPLEPRYAGIATEMLRTGDFLVPRYEGATYDEKPPLVFWASALALAGFPEDLRLFAARLPSAASAVLLVFLTWRFGRRRFDDRTGVLAALVLCTSFGAFWSARFLHLDLPHAAATAATIAAWFRAEESTGARRRLAIVAAGAALGAALLIKGPSAALVALAAAAGAAAGTRDARWLLRAGVIPSFAAAALVAGAWVYFAAREAGGSWAEELLVGNMRRRHDKPLEDDRNGPFFYVAGLFTSLAPWSLLLPSAAVAAWRTRRDPQARAALVAVATWIVVPLLLFSFTPMRRSRYIAPVLPALALLVGRFIGTRLEAAGRRRVLRGVVGAVGAALLVPATALMFPALASRLLANSSLASAPEALTGAAPRVFGALVGVAAAKALVGAARNRGDGGVAALFGALLALAASFGVVIAPAIDHARGDRPLVEILKAEKVAGRRTAIFGEFGGRESVSGFFAFYGGLEPATARPRKGGFAPPDGAPGSLLFVRASEIADGLPNPDPLRWAPVGDGSVGYHRLNVYRRTDAR